MISLTGLVLTPFATTSPIHAGELPPAVHARLLRPTSEVRLAQPVVTIPMVGTDQHGYYRCPYFQAYVNGHGPFTFLFDTGAAYTLVSSKVVAAAGLPVVFDRQGHRDVVGVSAIRIGGATLKGIWAIHDDDFGVDGIIGFPAFGMVNVLFDFSNRQLRVAHSPIALANSFELPYAAPLNVPTVPVQIGTRTIAVLIDTGDDAYGLEMRSEELAGASFVHPPIAAESVLNGSSEQPTRITTLADRLTLGPVHADAAVVAINDGLPVGDLGYDVLRQFRFEFEPRRQVVVFQPVFQGDRFSVPTGRSPGFAIGFDGRGKVSHVLPDSAAEVAGMAAGDEILTIDGAAPQTYSPRTWDARLESRTPLTVRWTHAGTMHEATLPIDELR